MKKHYGMHLGIVVNNQDPENRGRVQIFIPHIIPVIGKLWNQNKIDKAFKVIGDNLNDEGGLTSGLVKKLKNLLPWAECAAPIFGGGTSAVYNPSNKQTTISSPYPINVQPEGQADLPLQSQLNNTGDFMFNLTQFQANDLEGFQTAYKNNFSYYQAVSNNLAKQGINIPPQTVAALHYREGSGDLTKSIANGNAITSYVRKDGLVSGGNSSNSFTPSNSWVDHSTEVLSYELHDKYSNPESLDWSKPETSYDFAERFNGLGYRNKGVASPYIWSGTNIYTGGKFVSDGVYSSTAFDKQIGLAAMLKVASDTPIEGPLPTDNPNNLPDVQSGNTVVNNTPQESITGTGKTDNETGKESKSDEFTENVNIIKDLDHASFDVQSRNYTSQASGYFSIPDEGSKVWVFFNDGDAQYPIYFACQLDPAETKSFYQNTSPTNKHFVDDNNIGRTYGLMDKKSGGLELIAQYTKDPETGAWQNFSGARLSNVGGSHISLMNDRTIDFSAADRTVKTSGNVYSSVIGDSEHFTGGLSNQVYSKDVYIHVGQQTQKQQEATNDILKVLKDIQKDKNDAIKLDPNQTIDCPVCSQTYLVNKQAGTGGVFGFLRKVVPPYFSFPVDFLDQLTNTVAIPFLSQKRGSSLTGGHCSNPNCKNGKIPSIQKSVEQANKLAESKVKAEKTNINELEAKLGLGGSYSLIAKGDYVVQSGLKINETPAFKSVENGYPHPNAVVPAKTDSILVLDSKAKNLIVQNEPQQYPGGNITFIAGNKFSINAGTPGIELNTGGKAQINAALLNITGSEELILCTQNHAILKGKAVTIESNDDAGILFQSRNNLFTGRVGINSNATVKGGLAVDGNIYGKTLVMPIMREKTEMTGQPDLNTFGASWWPVSPEVAASNSTKKTLTHWSMLGYLLSLTGIVDVTTSTYTLTEQSVGLEPMQTGICVTSYGVFPVYNFKHLHMLPSMDHTHDYKLPNMVYLNKEKDMINHWTALNTDIPVPNTRGSGTPFTS